MARGVAGASMGVVLYGAILGAGIGLVLRDFTDMNVGEATPVAGMTIGALLPVLLAVSGRAI